MNKELDPLDSPFLPENQAEFAASQQTKRRRNLIKQLPGAIEKEAIAQADMRRAFNRWDKHRMRLAQIEKALDNLDKEDAET